MLKIFEYYENFLSEEQIIQPFFLKHLVKTGIGSAINLLMKLLNNYFIILTYIKIQFFFRIGF